jgi:hypothetical protein
MNAPRCLLVSSLVLASPGLVYDAVAQQPRPTPPVVQWAAAPSGAIHGTVLDERGEPLDGAVVSALGDDTAFAVTDKAGAFQLRQLAPGPYLVRAHLQGYVPARTTMVQVRPSATTPSSFTLRREGPAAAPRVLAAGFVTTDDDPTVDEAAPRSESEVAWRLRRLRRSILKDAEGLVDVGGNDRDWTDSLDFLGRAVESSARLAASLFSDLPDLHAQVNVLTTNALGGHGQAFDLDQARGVAFMSVGAAVGEKADWDVKVAMNQGDVSSWIMAGAYAVRAPARHRYEIGWSYSLQRYEGGNPAVLATMVDGYRNVGSVHVHDEFTINPRLSVGLGARYARYDYLGGPGLLSPRASVSFSPADRYRVRASASLSHSAPGAEEFLPPARAQWLPPQRTFAPLSNAGFRSEDVQHYELGVEREFDGASLGVRAFRQRIDNQLVTIFGLITPRTPAATLGHYYVASAGDVDIDGWGVTLMHAFSSHVRGSVDYTQARAEWVDSAPAGDFEMLEAWVPSAALLPQHQRIHDLSSSLEAEIPQSATRLLVFYKVNSAFLRRYGLHERAGIDGRFDVQVHQALPFLNFTNAQWEMLFGIRNLFRENPDHSMFDELLVVRPPKRIVGGVQVRF